jgi:hypothetical protein
MSGLSWFSAVREGPASRLRGMATTPFASMQQCPYQPSSSAAMGAASARTVAMRVTVTNGTAKPLRACWQMVLAELGLW